MTLLAVSSDDCNNWMNQILRSSVDVRVFWQMLRQTHLSLSTVKNECQKKELLLMSEKPLKQNNQSQIERKKSKKKKQPSKN